MVRLDTETCLAKTWKYHKNVIKIGSHEQPNVRVVLVIVLAPCMLYTSRIEYRCTNRRLLKFSHYLFNACEVHLRFFSATNLVFQPRPITEEETLQEESDYTRLIDKRERTSLNW
jgi:hypothetical protein